MTLGPFHYGQMIYSLARAKESGEALDTLKDMSARDVSPSIECYNAALTACANAGETERAKEVLSLLEADAKVEADEVTRKIEERL